MPRYALVKDGVKVQETDAASVHPNKGTLYEIEIVEQESGLPSTEGIVGDKWRKTVRHPRVIDWPANERVRLRAEAESLEKAGDQTGAIKLRLKALET